MDEGEGVLPFCQEALMKRNRTEFQQSCNIWIENKCDDKIILSVRMYRVFIKYCVFWRILKYIPDSDLSRFPLGISVCTQWQVETPALQQNWQSL